MAATWTVRERQLTATELAAAQRRGSLVFRYGCLLTPCLGLAILGLALGMLAGRMGALVGGVVGGALGVWGMMAYLRFDKRLERRRQGDLSRGAVEVIEVDGAEVVEIDGGHSSVSPAYAFELDGGQCLLLLGQWLFDAETYGTSAEEGCDDDDEPADTGNGLLPPFAFPSTAFTVHRLPDSGEVLRIDVRGDYAPPGEVLDSPCLPGINEFSSQLLECDFAGLQATIERLSEPGD